MNVTVTVFLNITTDYHGRPVGMLDGYQNGHSLSEAAQLQMTGPDDLAICEDVFRILNVGDDPEFGDVDERAVDYRRNGHRSLSVGDVVNIWQDNGPARLYAVAPFGFDRI